MSHLAKLIADDAGDGRPTGSAVATGDRDGQRASDPGTGRRRIGRVAAQVAVVGIAVGLWWLACAVIWAQDPILVQMGPAPTLQALWHLIVDGQAAGDIVISLRRLGLGLVIAAALGIPVGILIGSRPRLEDATSPVIQFVRMLSPLAWAPAAVAVFGIGNAPVTFLVAIATVFPILLGTAAAVRCLEPGWSLVARSLGATRSERLRTITLPGIRPQVLVSLRLALGVGWVVLVPAEMLGVTSGLGYAVLNARDMLAYDQVAATMVLIGVVGYVLDTAFRRLLGARS